MPRPASSEPTTGELEILQILWDTGPLALSQLCERIRAAAGRHHDCRHDAQGDAQ